VEIFPSLARSATGLENPNFYEICPQLALGEHGLGFGMLGYPQLASENSLENVLEAACS
jgi:hypothetical protein